MDDHMSSSGWNIKHLKVTFAKWAAAAAAVAAAATAGAKELGKKRQKHETLADTQTLGLQRRTSQMTTSLDHFALQRCLEREGINTGGGKKPQTSTLEGCWETRRKQSFIHTRLRC